MFRSNRRLTQLRDFSECLVRSRRNHNSHATTAGARPRKTLSSASADAYRSLGMESAPFVNNRNSIYIPVLLCCGVTINVRLGLLFLKPYLLPVVIATLNEDCTTCLKLLPHSVHALIRRTRIWVNGEDYRIGDQRNPQILHHMTTHHYEGWLNWYVTK